MLFGNRRSMTPAATQIVAGDRPRDPYMDELARTAMSGGDMLRVMARPPGGLFGRPNFRPPLQAGLAGEGSNAPNVAPVTAASASAPDATEDPFERMNRAWGLPPAMGTPLPAQPGGPLAMPPAVSRDGTLGGSRRQPYDYGQALAALLPPEKKRSTLQKIAEVLGPALLAMGGNQAGANAAFASLRERRTEADRRRWEANKLLQDWQHDDWSRTDGAELDASKPFTIGRNRLQYDPDTGEVQTLYDGPEDFEDYAATLGLEPGTQEYFDAVEDYVLRANGPTALENDQTLDNFRTGNRLKIEGVRQGNRESLESQRQKNRTTLRGTPSYRDTHPLPQRGGGGGARSSMPTATGPNGQKVQWNGTAWVPAR